ncbi:MAG TPA: hypothetical protein VMP67_09775 [Candidatus Limnocylindria bacterium]|nr:hypothetical protein [Candidatus Limnocylindria bacterium]
MKAAGRRRDTLPLIFAVTGGAWAWTLQLWLSWIVGEPLCFLQLGDRTLGAAPGALLWVAIGLGTGALAGAALVASYRLWRGEGGQSVTDEPGNGGPRRFLAYTGLVLNVLFLLAIAMGTTSPLWLPACA